MTEIAGRQVLTELAELVDPSRAALVVVDMQRDFVEPGYGFDQLGVDLSMYPAQRERVTDLLGAARAAGVLVVHVQMTTLPGRRSESPAQLRFTMRLHGEHHAGRPLTFTVLGEPGWEFVPEIVPAQGELVVPKWRSSGFWGTNLDLLLRSNGIESVVVCGCTTEGCVESTARDAMFNDYYVVVVTDAVASDDRAQHDASLLLMAHRFDLATSAAVVSCWAAA